MRNIAAILASYLTNIANKVTGMQLLLHLLLLYWMQCCEYISMQWNAHRQSWHKSHGIYKCVLHLLAPLGSWVGGCADVARQPLHQASYAQHASPANVYWGTETQLYSANILKQTWAKHKTNSIARQDKLNIHRWDAEARQHPHMVGRHECLWLL